MLFRIAIAPITIAPMALHAKFAPIKVQISDPYFPSSVFYRPMRGNCSQNEIKLTVRWMLGVSMRRLGTDSDTEDQRSYATITAYVL